MTHRYGSIFLPCVRSDNTQDVEYKLIEAVAAKTRVPEEMKKGTPAVKHVHRSIYESMSMEEQRRLHKGNTLHVYGAPSSRRLLPEIKSPGLKVGEVGRYVDVHDMQIIHGSCFPSSSHESFNKLSSAEQGIMLDESRKNPNVRQRGDTVAKVIADLEDNPRTRCSNLLDLKLPHTVSMPVEFVHAFLLVFLRN